MESEVAGLYMMVDIMVVCSQMLLLLSRKDYDRFLWTLLMRVSASKIERCARFAVGWRDSLVEATNSDLIRGRC